MIRLISILALSVFCYGLNLAQSDGNSAPINWQRYRASKHISILLPKLPVRFDRSDICNETDISEYWAFADETVFELRIVSKSSVKIPRECSEKSRFGQATLEKRIREVGGLPVKLPSPDDSGLSRSVFKAATKTSTRWLVADLKNNKWVELSITLRHPPSGEETNYVSSLKFEDVPDAIDIGNGSLWTLGDKLPVLPETAPVQSTPVPTIESSEGVMIVSKKAPKYTDAARYSNIQGTVILRVAFLGNGAIGTVGIIKGLPYGLTEQSIAVARKILFLPQKTKGINVSVTKQIEYSFSIY